MIKEVPINGVKNVAKVAMTEYSFINRFILNRHFSPINLVNYMIQ